MQSSKARYRTFLQGLDESSGTVSKITFLLDQHQSDSTSSAREIRLIPTRGAEVGRGGAEKNTGYRSVDMFGERTRRISVVLLFLNGMTRVI